MKNFLFFLIFLIFSNNAAANTLVAWDTNTDADYYVVYWGDAPGDYSSNSNDIPANDKLASPIRLGALHIRGKI